MASSIEIKHLTKEFGNTAVLNDISFSIKNNEFVVFLGPSGCGKSTLLRMIAGLESLSDGEIWMDGQRLDTQAPGERGISMVFQNYALYPHMTVEGNMVFGLKNIGTPPAEIEKRVADAARILEIEHLLDRKPADLSGGQRQRVAIGRAIVRQPRAFLFDEPLSNLDAALRSRTRIELAQLHHRVNSTMIYVTHDQIEAMTLADRIVILNQSHIEQIGSPIDIYRYPASKFVARFVGSPAMNILPIDKLERNDTHVTAHIDQVTPIHTTIKSTRLPEQGPFEMGIRAEDVYLTDDPSSAHAHGEVQFIERLGDRTLAHVLLDNQHTIIVETSSKQDIENHQRVAICVDVENIHLFDAAENAYQGGRHD
ncbi:ABC transporter ATP-binding protein [Vibrio zhugei]|uniref:ABC transporter ATP-binding protein n=1 Tax=Vibrio zhugei TaxID=2479546 RepID=A0ABV7C8Z0_9VIBR|nr:sn-glycerol-3-phosphate ABC transporter ATP-binding protein UgpC [Vibrio zhugei]